MLRGFDFAFGVQGGLRDQIEGDPETAWSWKMGDGRTLAGKASLNAEGGDVVADGGYHLCAEWVL